jgi:hypothetical protein
MRPLVVLGLASLVLAGACLNFGQSSGGGGSAAGSTLPLPVPPAPGTPACLDDAESTCTDPGAVAAYTQCILAQCQGAYATCFGANFASGAFDGDCKDYGACTAACATCDTGCLDACAKSHQTGACAACIAQTIRTCAFTEIGTGTCKTPCAAVVADAGAGDGGVDASVASDAGGSHGACSSLTLCCNVLPPEDAGSCQVALAQTNDDDTACANVLATYKANGKCP